MSAEWEINVATTQFSETTVTIGLKKSIEGVEAMEEQLKGSTLAGKQGIWFKNGATEAEMDAITKPYASDAQDAEGAEENKSADGAAGGSRRLAGDGTIYAEQMELEIVWQAEEEEDDQAVKLVSMIGAASLAIASLVF